MILKCTTQQNFGPIGLHDLLHGHRHHIAVEIGDDPDRTGDDEKDDHDRNTLRLRLDLEGDPSIFEPGMSVWLKR
jgi:hypothetical protein